MLQSQRQPVGVGLKSWARMGCPHKLNTSSSTCTSSKASTIIASYYHLSYILLYFQEFVLCPVITHLSPSCFFSTTLFCILCILMNCIVIFLLLPLLLDKFHICKDPWKVNKDEDEDYIYTRLPTASHQWQTLCDRRNIWTDSGSDV
jgi:hypothetical protein